MGTQTILMPRGTSTIEGHSLHRGNPRCGTATSVACGKARGTSPPPPPRLHEMATTHALSASQVKSSLSQEQRQETIICTVPEIEAAAASILWFS